MSKSKPNPYESPQPGDSNAEESVELSDSARAYERIILIFGASWFFLILFGYYILRPIREEISSTYGIENLAWMFWVTFGVMLVAIPLYSILVGRFNRKTLVPAIYILFIAILISFWAARTYAPLAAQVWIARSFFVFISFYGLFVVSFFWSVIGDMVSTGQGRRLFGYVAGGGTIGGLVGSQVTALTATRIGQANLILIPAVLLAIALVIYFLLERFAANYKEFQKADTSGKATGGNPFAGFTAVFKSRYLVAICLYGAFLATCGTTVYFQQSEIVNAAYAPEGLEASWTEAQIETAKEGRTTYFANVNFAVNIVTLFFQFVIVGWLMKRVGLGVTLTVLPLAYLIGISSLAICPTLGVLAVISVLGRSAEYGIANPAREVLFTSVNREDRYKAKSFIDTVVRRGGDTVVGSAYRGLRESAGFAMSTLSWLIAPLAIAWAVLGFFIGMENKKVVAKIEADEN